MSLQSPWVTPQWQTVEICRKVYSDRFDWHGISCYKLLRNRKWDVSWHSWILAIPNHVIKRIYEFNFREVLDSIKQCLNHKALFTRPFCLSYLSLSWHWHNTLNSEFLSLNIYILKKKNYILISKFRFPKTFSHTITKLEYIKLQT